MICGRSTTLSGAARRPATFGGHFFQSNLIFVRNRSPRPARARAASSAGVAQHLRRDAERHAPEFQGQRATSHCAAGGLRFSLSFQTISRNVYRFGNAKSSEEEVFAARRVAARDRPRRAQILPFACGDHTLLARAGGRGGSAWAHWRSKMTTTKKVHNHVEGNNVSLRCAPFTFSPMVPLHVKKTQTS